ncbi:terminase large subunit [Bacillus phage Pookie]|uniref:Terminase large subunit n=1 Tax=Bacillus phage Pookie TaxID=1540093 RepID=A0A0A0RNT3_9CAUD|nr:terminase large subunit [Bacillus phage Pookie]AIW03687.1 terminase large subunit [Bacillus phage Pookie]
MLKLSESQRIAVAIEAQKELARRNYGDYVTYVHQGRYVHARHTLFITDVLQRAIENKKKMRSGEIETENQYIMINMPPRHGKSMTATETYPSYYLGHFPEDRVIEISYNDTFAKKFGKKNKEKVRQFGADLFGVNLSKRATATDTWYLENEIGGMLSRGALAGITGEGADLMLIDDPIKNREEADSETHREKLWNEWVDSFSSRLHPGAIVIIILTRWHEDDLQGRLLSKEYGEPLPWQVYNFPLEADEKHVNEEGNQLNREIGEPLWPERYGKKFIEQRKLYPSSFNSLYQGRPTAAEGNMLKRHWWNFYDEYPIVAQELISVDATFKDKDDSDYVSIQVWGKVGMDMYLKDRIKARMNFPATLKAVRNMIKRHPAAVIRLIEDKANGTAIISMLHREIGGIIAVNPQGGKVARVQAVSPFIESGNVWLPRHEPFTQEIIEEAAAFPNGAHDDDVDSMSQALNRFIYHTGELPEPEKPPLPQAFQTNHDEEGDFLTW